MSQLGATNGRSMAQRELSRRIAVTAVALAASACSGSVKSDAGDAGTSGRHPVDAGQGGSTSTNAGGSAARTDASTGASAGSGGTASGGASSMANSSLCDGLQVRVASMYELSVQNADLTCAVDDDCVRGPKPDCSSDCAGPVVSRAAVPALESAVKSLGTYCDDYRSHGCLVANDAPCPVVWYPSCFDGKCAALPSLDWYGVQFDVQSGTCLATGACSPMLILTTTDGATTVTEGTKTRTSVLGAAELRTVDTIVKSARFRNEVENGFGCDGAPDKTRASRSSASRIPAARSSLRT